MHEEDDLVVFLQDSASGFGGGSVLMMVAGGFGGFFRQFGRPGPTAGRLCRRWFIVLREFFRIPPFLCRHRVQRKLVKIGFGVTKFGLMEPMFGFICGTK